MRHFLISALLLSLLAGCSSIGPHRIDVQQGNALDQENVARLKTGLNRSQVRFLLGTPLVVDPFRTDRWDYVYLYYKAGKLTEQKHITLFFDGDTLVRIEGDLPEPKPDSKPAPATPTAQAPAAEPAAQPAPAVAAPVAAPIEPVARPEAAGTEPVPRSSMADTSIVPPLPSPKDAPADVDSHPVAESSPKPEADVTQLSLKPATDVTRIKPDAMPSLSGSDSTVATNEDPIVKSVNTWADAWARRDVEAYFAAYDTSFLPQDGDSRAAWEARKRKVLDAAKRIEVKIDSPSVEKTGDDSATVTFKQYYRSDTYHDAVVKQLRMVERGDRWLIAEENVLSVLKDGKP